MAIAIKRHVTNMGLACMMSPDPEMATREHSPVDRVPREFHVSRTARETYDMPDSLFGVTGNVVFADFRAAQLFAHRMNEHRDLE